MQAAIYNKTTNASFRNMHSMRPKKETLSIQDNRPEFSKQSELLKIIQGKELALPASQDVIQRRIPGFDGLKSVCDNPGYSIEEIRGELTILLRNMATEGFRLTAFDGRTLVDAETAAASLIKVQDGKPSVNEAYFRLLFEPTGGKYKEYLYIAPQDAETMLQGSEIKKMEEIAQIAIHGVDQTLNKPYLVECIFDKKCKTALGNYCKIRKVLEGIINSTVITTTDYNGDYKQIGVKGYKSNRRVAKSEKFEPYIHFAALSMEDSRVSAITAIHECAHYIDSTISDYVYSDAPGFEEENSEIKIRNAAHYEVVPRWLLLGYAITASPTTTSIAFRTEEFKAGKVAAVNYFREAYAPALNMFTQFRELYVEKEKSETVGEIKPGPQSDYISAMKIPIVNNQPDLLTISVAEDIVHTILIMYYNIRDDKVTIDTEDGKRDEIKDRYIVKSLADNQLRILNKMQMDYLVFG